MSRLWTIHYIDCKACIFLTLYLTVFLSQIIFAPLVPSLAPDFIAAHNKSSTSLIVKWSQLPVKCFQGEPIGYNITYYPVDFKSDKLFVTANYILNSTVLSNLTLFTMYIISVSAVSSGGIGPANAIKAGDKRVPESL